MSATFFADRTRTQLGFAASCYGYGSGASYRGPVCASSGEAHELHSVHHPKVTGVQLQAWQDELGCASGARHAELSGLLDRAYDCDFDGVCTPVFDTDGDPEVNMSNGNAARVAELLGLAVDDGDPGMPLVVCGSMDAESFIGSVLLALALVPHDAGVPATVVSAPGRATVVHGGRPEGYLQHRLQQLLEVGEFAREHGAMVVWG